MTVAALTGAALAGAGGGATALAQPSPTIVVKDGVTQPVFSYKDAIPIGYMDQKQFSYVALWDAGSGAPAGGTCA